MADLDEIKQMFVGGMSATAIADEVGASVGYISRLLSAMGLSGSAKRKTVTSKLTDADRSDAIDMYQSGAPVAAIIFKYNLNYNAFYKLLKDEGVEMRDRSPDVKKIRNERLDLAMKLYQKGLTINQIEIETGVRQPEIHREVTRRGIPMRRPHVTIVQEDDGFDLSDLTDREKKMLLPDADKIPGPSGKVIDRIKKESAQKENLTTASDTGLEV